MASLAFDPNVVLVVDMIAMAPSTKTISTTVIISSSENPCSFLRLLIPELLRLHPVTCRVTRGVHVPHQCGLSIKYNVFINLEGMKGAGEAARLGGCNKTLQVATFETRCRTMASLDGDEPTPSEKEAGAEGCEKDWTDRKS